MTLLKQINNFEMIYDPFLRGLFIQRMLWVRGKNWKHFGTILRQMNLFSLGLPYFPLSFATLFSTSKPSITGDRTFSALVIAALILLAPNPLIAAFNHRYSINYLPQGSWLWCANLLLLAQSLTRHWSIWPFVFLLVAFLALAAVS